ncbi:hypothetical protein XELAEV_18035336mg [Xenopus laevis]|uniref:Uncharacterized protein n=1 Tax=Xenopus laevis TaxID=8355 RepID=A0A974CFE5_XENLA|nr:hypothetical protein XELAEV_18035336mg [Xenopus laevis]
MARSCVRTRHLYLKETAIVTAILSLKLLLQLSISLPYFKRSLLILHSGCLTFPLTTSQVLRPLRCFLSHSLPPPPISCHAARSLFVSLPLPPSLNSGYTDRVSLPHSTPHFICGLTSRSLFHSPLHLPSCSLCPSSLPSLWFYSTVTLHL